MSKISTVLSLSLIVTFLTACSEKTQTLQWYKEHPEVLAQEVEKCNSKPLAKAMKDKHCKVIRQAQKEEFDDLQRDRPIRTVK